jgi:hypothetical protein
MVGPLTHSVGLRITRIRRIYYVCRGVERSGKWAAFDVSAQGAFATLIGDTLASVEPVLTEPGK